MSHQQQQIYTQALRFIREYQMIQPGDRVIVGVSGGIDSVALLSLFHDLRDRLAISLFCAHLNHQFRGAEAEGDAEFVRQLAARLAIPCYIESSDVPALIAHTKRSPQDAARQARYEFFETLAQRLGAQKIATAHTADDQAETVLLGLLRGVGLHGLGGIQPVLRGQIIRPLLTTTRRQIEAYTQALGLEYRMDSSNLNRKYLRNAVRLDLLPVLQQHFTPAIVPRLTAYAQTFREDAEFIAHIAHERYPQICQNMKDSIKIDLDLFVQECITIQRALIYQAAEQLTGTRHWLETKHVRAVLELFRPSTPGKQLALPGGVRAVRTPAGGELRKQTRAPENVAPELALAAIPGVTQNACWRIETTLVPASTLAGNHPARAATSGGWVQAIDFERLNGSLMVRTRRPGDVFQPLGLPGKKTVKKFFIDRKIPRDKRRDIPLLVDSSGIIWVIGYAIADRVKITPATQQALLCQMELLMKSET